MIVKVQASLFTTQATRRALIYDEDRVHMYEGELTEAVESILDGRPKAFFFAKLIGTTIEIGAEAPWQEW